MQYSQLIFNLREATLPHGLPYRILETALQISLRTLQNNRSIFGETNHYHFPFFFQKNRILSVGFNRARKTHPLGKAGGYKFETIHSELDSYIRMDTMDMRKIKLLNLRLSSDSLKYKGPVLRPSKPCVCCSSWLSNLGIKRIYFSDNNGIQLYDTTKQSN